MQRDLDIVVFGATGDTGFGASSCLFFKGKKLGITSWAPAARNLDKLKRDLLDRLEGADPGPDGVAPAAPIMADSGDYDSLVSMCRRARCVIACAGPFAQYGELVVRACVETGTHYVDVTGEVPWVEKMERKYGEDAQKNGVTLVSMAGYDSVPPDLTTFLAAKAMRDEGEVLGRFDLFCGGAGGAAPTGTINTVVEGVDGAKSQFWRTVTFGLVGGKASPSKPRLEGSERLKGASGRSSYVPETEKQNLESNLRWTMLPGYSSLARQFCLPHFMAPININVVHRSAAKEGYGGLVYRERMGGLPSGAASLSGLVPTLCGVGGAMMFGAFLCLPYASSAVLKARDTFNPPATLRTREKMVAGFLPTGKTTAHGFGISRSGGMTANVELSSDYDPGLGFTTLSACTIASRIVKGMGTERRANAGFNTSVTAFGGEALADAFQNAGVQIKVTTLRA